MFLGMKPLSKKIYFIFILVFFLQAHAQKNSIEDIFIWKVSDELQFTAKQEKQFSDIHKSLNAKKLKLNDAQTQLVKQLNQKSLSETELKKHLQNFRQNLLQLNEISLQEFEQTRKALGDKKMGEYLVFKQELAEKFKSLLVDQKNKPKDIESKKTSELATPAVIEEK